jgi:energy-coupling factor transport system ATP-binding protein
MISLEAVTVSLPPGKPNAKIILKEISFSVQAGEKIAIVGRNGSGKTTLLQTIAGLLPLVSGSVAVLQSNVTACTECPPPSMALLVQEADNQFVASSVRNELLLGLPDAAQRDADAGRRVEMTAERFDLTEVLERNPHRLSGGEKQRLAFATIWMAEPDILLLDEPTTHLDAPSRNRCFEFVDTLCGDDSTVVWATPGGEDLMRADRVLWLDSGEIRYFGSIKEFLEDYSALEKAGIVLPPLAALSSNLADSIPGLNLDTAMLEPDGRVASPIATNARVSMLAEHVLSSLDRSKSQNYSRLESGGPVVAAGDGSASDSAERIIVAFDDVYFSYEFCNAIRQVSVQIREGQCVGVAGLNGSGKSTLLSLASGVLQPSRGEINRLYESAFEAGEQNVFHLFQNPEQMFFAETVREELAFGLRHVHGHTIRLDAPIMQALKQAELEPDAVIERSPVSLSFGEMRRLAFAVFISLRPKFLLLDEPTACLDDSGRRVLRGVLNQFILDGGTVMVASHDEDFLFEVCDRLIYLGDGRILHDIDLSSKSLPEDFEWPHEPQPLILALQSAIAHLGAKVTPRVVTADRLLANLSHSSQTRKPT